LPGALQPADKLRHLQQIAAFTTMAKEAPSFRLSILICNYNQAHYIRDCLTAIASQTMVPYEVILVDDGSTDGGVDAAMKFRHALPRFRVVRSWCNRGVNAAINWAVELAEGTHMAWAAADDVLLPDFVETAQAFFHRYPESSICCSELGLFSSDPAKWRRLADDARIAHIFSHEDLNEFLDPRALQRRLERTYLSISGNTVVVRLDEVRKLGGFDGSLEWHSDFWTYLVVALRNGLGVLQGVHAIMREDPSSYSRSAMNTPEFQLPVLRSLLSRIEQPAFRDVAEILRSCPSVLAVFGPIVLGVLMERPARWMALLKVAAYLERNERRMHNLDPRRAAPRYLSLLAGATHHKRPATHSAEAASRSGA